MKTQGSFEFGPYRLDPSERLLLCDGQPVPLPPKAFELLVALVSRAGHLATREDLLREVWPGTFVEEANLSYTVSLIRKALKDDAEPHRYIETVPRAGYRFTERVTTVAPRPEAAPSADSAPAIPKQVKSPSRRIAIGSLAVAALVLSALAWQLRRGRDAPPAPAQRVLKRLTFDPGLQMQPTWSPDGRFIAYSSDRSGNFDIWVQPVAGGDAVQVTKDLAHDWQPDWSPDGSQIVFRSERQGGGLFLVRALGGDERRLAALGFTPRWSPDGTRILLAATDFPAGHGERPSMYLVRLDGGPPRRILSGFLDGFSSRPAVAWHPDGQRLSFWGIRPAEGLTFWTVPAEGDAPVNSELAPDVRRAMAAASLRNAYRDAFAWGPAGDTLFFVGTSLEVRNIWKVGVDPKTLRWTTGPERLTTGPGADTDLALSRDGRSIAFGNSTANPRVWVFPFDPAAGKMADGGQAVTPQELRAFAPDITRDGRKVLFFIEAPGRKHHRQLIERSLADGRERRLANDDMDSARRTEPRWSPDGTHIAYGYFTGPAFGRRSVSIRILETATGLDQQLTSPHDAGEKTDSAWGWSSDGQWLVVSGPRYAPERMAITLVPLSAAPHAESKERVVTSDTSHWLYQAVLSPDDRWIAFQAASRGDTSVSTLYAIPTRGGTWTQITEGGYWDDKPRWSPDGNTLYFVSSRQGVFNVFGIRFDPSRGLPLGEAFPVTSFESPRRMLWPNTGNMEMAVARDRLVLNLVDRTGSIWMLENLDTASVR